MSKVYMKGLPEFRKLLESHTKADLGNIKAVVSNNAPHINALEYGSKIGEKPWPNPGDKTEVVVSEYDNQPKIVSKQGYAMVRSSMADTQEVLEKRLKKIDLTKPIRNQVVKSVNFAGAFLLKEVVVKTPVDEGNARQKWKLDKAD